MTIARAAALAFAFAALMFANPGLARAPDAPAAPSAKFALPPPLDAVCGYEIERFCPPAEASARAEEALYQCLAERPRELGRTCQAALVEIEKDRARARELAAVTGRD